MDLYPGVKYLDLFNNPVTLTACPLAILLLMSLDWRRGGEETDQSLLLPSQIYGEDFRGGHIIRGRYLGLSMDYSTP